MPYKDKERAREYQRKYYQKNKESLKRKRAIQRKEVADEYRERLKKWREAKKGE